MADLELEITAEMIWTKSHGDCSECCACGDLIFYNKYELSISINGSKARGVDVNICESCFDCLNND